MSELVRLTKDAAKAKSAYEKAESIAKDQGLDPTVEPWVLQLKQEYKTAVAACRREAGSPSQTALKLSDPNSLGLTEDEFYWNRESRVRLKFVRFDAETELFHFTSPAAGDISGSADWVSAEFDLVAAVDLELPRDGEETFERFQYGDLELIVKRVSPERFAEICKNVSPKIFDRRPTAKGTEVINDQSYVVIKIEDQDNRPTAILAPVAPCSDADKEGIIFKIEKARWKICKDIPYLALRIASVEAIVDTPDTGTAVQSDPTEYAFSVLRLEREKIGVEERANIIIAFAPRSFKALAEQNNIEIDPERTIDGDVSISIAAGELGGLLAVCKADGLEIPGYEELVDQPTEGDAAVVAPDRHLPLPDFDWSTVDERNWTIKFDHKDCKLKRVFVRIMDNFLEGHDLFAFTWPSDPSLEPKAIAGSQLLLAEKTVAEKVEHLTEILYELSRELPEKGA
jgi:hypothetical protein